MKRSDLKELIKKSMLEVSPTSGAMTPEEEKMVAGYEEEEANKYALDKEEPMEEASVILNHDEVYDKYAPLVKQYMKSGLDKHAAILKAQDVLAKEYGATPLNIQSTISDYFDDQDRNATYANENVLREADEIVAAWAEKQTLNEADLSQANFNDLHQVIKNIAHVNEIGMEEAAMQAIEYIAEQFDVPVDFRDF